MSVCSGYAVSQIKKNTQFNIFPAKSWKQGISKFLCAPPKLAAVSYECSPSILTDVVFFLQG